MKGYSLQDLASETCSSKPEALQWDTEKSKGENVPLGLQLFRRACRNDVICFYKTQFKFVPAFQELQQSASVETSCIPYFRTLECLLHQNPANHGVCRLARPNFPLPPHLKQACAARLRPLLSTLQPLERQSHHSVPRMV